MGKPFAQAITMFRLIAAAIAAAGSDSTMRKELLGEIGPYESRGHGGKSPRRPTGVAACRRAAAKHRNVNRNRRAHRG